MRLTFWIAAVVILYVYAGYPVMLALFARFGRRVLADDLHRPAVSLIIAAHNEGKVIRSKIDNALALDYPSGRLEIMVVSDGSTDETDETVCGYAARGVTLHRMPRRGGKTRALNHVVPRARGEIVVLSDANTMYRTDALSKMMRHFADASVGAVSGDVQLVDSADSYAASEGLYYQYERAIQRLESRLGSIIGADGGMYALRKELFRPPSDAIVVDDFVISMNVARLGYRVVYEPEAVAVEQGTLSGAEEFRRKVRIVAGGVQALLRREGVPRISQPVLMWSYVSHKLLRWLIPVFLIVLFLASVALSAEYVYAFAFVVQLAGYLAGLAYAVLPTVTRSIPGASVAFYFCLVNAAAMNGIWRGLGHLQTSTWARTTR